MFVDRYRCVCVFVDKYRCVCVCVCIHAVLINVHVRTHQYVRMHMCSCIW